MTLEMDIITMTLEGEEWVYQGNSDNFRMTTKPGVKRGIEDGPPDMTPQELTIVIKSDDLGMDDHEAILAAMLNKSKVKITIE